jgi:hypothetical protein
MGWALGSVVAASDRDIEHAAKLFDGMFVFHGRNPDEGLGGDDFVQRGLRGGSRSKEEPPLGEEATGIDA